MRERESDEIKKEINTICKHRIGDVMHSPYYNPSVFLVGDLETHIKKNDVRAKTSSNVSKLLLYYFRPILVVLTTDIIISTCVLITLSNIRKINPFFIFRNI